MNTLGRQFLDIVSAKMPVAFEKAGQAMGNMIADQMEENTEKGTAFGSDPYVNVYHPQSVFDRKRLGLQTGTVNLRRTSKRIETTRVVKIKGTGASIDFEQGGQIFKEHHMGKALSRPFNRNVPMRSIFPKSHASVPDNIIYDTKIVIAEELSGIK
jgi:hypothetical protein